MDIQIRISVGLSPRMKSWLMGMDYWTVRPEDIKKKDHARKKKASSKTTMRTTWVYTWKSPAVWLDSENKTIHENGQSNNPARGECRLTEGKGTDPIGEPFEYCTGTAKQEAAEMDTKIIIELIGYSGSILVLISMLMTSVIRLRVINLTGSVIFAVYALMIRSYPTAIMNFCLAGINIYHLRRLLMEQKQYDLIPLDARDGYFSFLLRNSEEDIRYWFPTFSAGNVSADLALLVCCDGNPACLFMGKLTKPGEVEVVLDYAMPVYRDTSVGRFLYRWLAREGYCSLVFRQDAPMHTPYLKKIGYQQNRHGEYVLNLSDFSKS